MAILCALAIASAAAAPHKPAAAKAPQQQKCKKHLIVTFAVYQELQSRDPWGNGCWTAEATVQDEADYAICHFNRPPPAKRQTSIYDDVNPRHAGEHKYLVECAAAGDRFWQYLVPPFEPVIKGFKKLHRLYAELYDSSTRSPMPYLGQWRRKKVIEGHHVWPMIDVSEHAGSTHAINKAVQEICHELPDHGILGIYSLDPVTRAPPKDKALFEKECVDRKNPKSQHCNGRRAAIVEALDACTGGARH